MPIEATQENLDAFLDRNAQPYQSETSYWSDPLSEQA